MNAERRILLIIIQRSSYTIIVQHSPLSFRMGGFSRAASQHDPADHRLPDHSVAPVGIKKVRMAGGTDPDRSDRFAPDAGGQGLMSHELSEVQHGSAAPGLPYHQLPLSETLPEARQDRFIHFVATGADRWSNHNL